ncbi:hypothetical protein ABDD95_09360 [Mucilaginibacter sp. PAMB04274]|uniref:hypothetical protein n=1 Tax=Mucilaginibacter sp. PAMB04274 TaxID=3138568 RepID=UPI0031F63662
MKKILILSAIFIASGSVYTWGHGNQVKPTNVLTNSTVTAIKLAEAKAALSKANTKNVKSNLGTADGGI